MSYSVTLPCLPRPRWAVRVVRAASFVTVALPMALSAQGRGSTVPNAPIQRERRIGVILGSPEQEFGFVSSIAILPDDRIAVADLMAQNVRIFTFQGAYVATAGRSGAGPGEFRSMSALVADTLLRVLDFQQQRITSFTFDGELAGTERLQSVSQQSVSRLAHLAFGQVIGATANAISWQEPGHQPDVFVFHLKSGGYVDTLARFNGGATVWYSPQSATQWGTVRGARFGAAGAWATKDSVLALADGYTGEVRFLVGRPDGSLVEVSRVPLPGQSRAVESSDLREVEDFLRAMYERVRRPLPRRIAFEAPQRWSIATRAFFAGDGSLWVCQGVDGEGREQWSVLDLSGVRGAWKFPAGLWVMAASSTHVAGRGILDGDAQAVGLYRWVLR